MPRQSDVGQAASAKTSAQFAHELSALTAFSEAEVTKFFPVQEDAEALKKLIAAVKTATDENDKRAKLIGNIESVARVVTKLATKLVLP